MTADAHLKRRHLKDRLFRGLSRLAALLALGFLLVFIGGLVYWAWEGFWRFEAKVSLPAVHRTVAHHTEESTPETLMEEIMAPYGLPSGARLHLFAPSWHKYLHQVCQSPALHRCPGTLWLPLEDSFDKALKRGRILSPPQQALMTQIQAHGHLRKKFRTDFFTNSDSRDPQTAGIFAGFVSTLFLCVITLVLSFPIAVFAAFYLEEMAPPSRLTRLIDVNIANLAAVPSVVFGILGLALFINFFGLPRSSSLVGGMTLSLMTLPTLIVASRSAIQGVPKSIKQAAQGLGASDMQIIMHHIFPMALPGIITGTLIALARALGETAPLLMVGMMAFIRDVPEDFLAPAAPLPVQIFSWVRNPEVGFLANASAGILVLLLFLGVLNTVAIYLRGKYEQKW